jgi:DNA-binding transcriptional LysR family regulator
LNPSEGQGEKPMRPIAQASDLNISLLREFVVLSQVLNFTKAAAILGVTQATLSKHLTVVERAVGERLLERTTASVALTPRGERFLEDANNVVLQFDRALFDRGRTAEAPKCVVLAGFEHPWLEDALAEAVCSFHREGLRVDLALEGRSFVLASEMLEESQADVVFLASPHGVDLAGRRSRALFSDQLVAMLPVDHALATREELALSDLEGEPLLVPKGTPAFDMHHWVRELCERRGFQPRIVIRRVERAIELITTRAFDEVFLAAAGVAQSLPMARSSGFCTRRVAEEDCRLQVTAVWRPDAPSFVEAFVERLAETAPGA